MAEENPLRKAIEISTNLANAAWHSRLKKYFVYSVVIHAVLLILLSTGGIIDMARGASDDEAGAQATTNAQPEPDEPPTAPGTVLDDTAPTGDRDDYFRRAGIDTTPPPADQTPGSPDDILDDLLRPGGR